MSKDSGANPGSRKPSPAVSALAGFDPERFEDMAEGCVSIDRRLGGAISSQCCESVEQLERLHDRLVNEVSNITAFLREVCLAIAMEARRAETVKHGSVGDDSAAIAQPSPPISRETRAA